jgi:voltage-gated potassium channel
MNTRKKRIFDIIQIGKRDDWVSRAFDIFIVTVIILNIAVLFMETFDELLPYASVFNTVETVTVIIFCVEYALRIWTAQYLYPDCSHAGAVAKFMCSFDGIVDLCTILPFFFLSGFVAFRMLRVVRIFHLFRINAYYDSFNVITSVLYEKRNQIISSVFIILVLMMSSSLCMYSAEHEAQPEVFNNAFSGMWWSISTILTVGYGDIYPVTVFGRIMAIVIAFLGVGVVAIPTGIISAGFVEQYTQMQNRSKTVQARQVLTVRIDSSEPFCNMRVKQIEEDHNIAVVVVIRNGETILPAQNTKVKTGDMLVYQTENI